MVCNQRLESHLSEYLSGHGLGFPHDNLEFMFMMRLRGFSRLALQNLLGTLFAPTNGGSKNGGYMIPSGSHSISLRACIGANRKNRRRSI